MMEACTVSHAENKRSLPAWMLKGSSGNEVAKKEVRNKEALESGEKTEALVQIEPVKRRNGRLLKTLNSEGACELGGLRRCQVAEKARRKSKGAIKDEVEDIGEGTSNKNARMTTRRAAPKNTRKRKLESVKPEASSPVTSDDDIDLTVEDLLSIAEEILNADKQKQNQLDTVKNERHKENIPCATVSSEAGTRESVIDAPSLKGLMQCTTVTRNTIPSEHIGDENNSHLELQCSSGKKLQCSSRMQTTEDVGRDMLNIFLGHLSSKPADSTKKSEPIESVGKTINRVPEKKDWHTEVLSQGEPVEKIDPVPPMTMTINRVPENVRCSESLGEPMLGEPVTKKKTSLRDKVALFL